MHREAKSETHVAASGFGWLGSTTVVAEGQPAPDFTLASDTGENVSLADLRGTSVVLYFYPKDDTRRTY